MDDNENNQEETHDFPGSSLFPLTPMLMLLDALVVYSSGYLTSCWLETYTDRSWLVENPRYGLMWSICGLTFPLVLKAISGYEDLSCSSVTRRFWQILSGWSLVFIAALIVTIGFKVSGSYSRVWLGLWGAVTLVMLFAKDLLARVLIVKFLSQLIKRRKIAVIGGGVQGERLLREFSQPRSAKQFELVAWFGAGIRLSPDVVVGSEDDALCQLQSGLGEQIDEVWILQSDRALTLARELSFSNQIGIFTLRFLPDLRGFRLNNQGVSRLGSHLLIGLSPEPYSGVDLIFKAALDRSGAFVGLLMLLPVFIVLAVAIKLESKGPVFFVQRRHGRSGRVFRIYKFRTMGLAHSHVDGQPLRQVERQDARVTRVGKILRAWSLDELPQLLNVLAGDMSLVGPRPHEVTMNQQAAQRDIRYRLRHRVKPGITGWAQVHGLRGPAITDEQLFDRLQYDLWYIDNWSVWLDLRILVMTMFVGFKHTNAY